MEKNNLASLLQVSQHRPGSIRVREKYITIRLAKSDGYDSPENQAKHLKVAREDSNC
jgi:hypothetical protein